MSAAIYRALFLHVPSLHSDDITRKALDAKINLVKKRDG